MRVFVHDKKCKIFIKKVFVGHHVRIIPYARCMTYYIHDFLQNDMDHRKTDSQLKFLVKSVHNELRDTQNIANLSIFTLLIMSPASILAMGNYLPFSTVV